MSQENLSLVCKYKHMLINGAPHDKLTDLVSIFKKNIIGFPTE